MVIRYRLGPFKPSSQKSLLTRGVWGNGAAWDKQPHINHLFVRAGIRQKKQGPVMLSKNILLFIRTYVLASIIFFLLVEVQYKIIILSTSQYSLFC